MWSFGSSPLLLQSFLSFQTFGFSVRCLVVKSNLALRFALGCSRRLAPCCKPSVFTSMEASLNGRLYHRRQKYADLLQSVLDFSPYCEGGFFFTQETILPTSTLVCPLWSPGLLMLSSSAVQFYCVGLHQIVHLASHKVFVVSLILFFFSYLLQLRIVAPVKKLPNTNSSPEISSGPFIRLMLFAVTTELTFAACQSIVQILLGP